MLHVHLDSLFSYVLLCKQKTAYVLRISDWSSDVCSSDLPPLHHFQGLHLADLPKRLGWCGRVLPDVLDPRADLVHTLAPNCRDVTLRESIMSTTSWMLLIFEASRSEEHTSELQSLMRISYAVFCLNKKKKQQTSTTN